MWQFCLKIQRLYLVCAFMPKKIWLRQKWWQIVQCVCKSFMHQRLAAAWWWVFFFPYLLRFHEIRLQWGRRFGKAKKLWPWLTQRWNDKRHEAYPFLSPLFLSVSNSIWSLKKTLLVRHAICLLTVHFPIRSVLQAKNI